MNERTYLNGLPEARHPLFTILVIFNRSYGYDFILDSSDNKYVYLIPDSLKERLNTIIQSFDEITNYFAYKTYPTNIRGIQVPIFNHIDELRFNQINEELVKCDYSLRQILNKLSSI